MGFISGLGLKGWAIIAIVIAVLGFVGKYEYDMAQLREADKTIVTQGVTIADQKDTIKTGEIVADVKDEVHDTVNKDTAKVEATHKDVVKTLWQKEQGITDKFKELPVTAENLVAEQQQLSTARIDAMWDLYCKSVPNATECPVNSPEGVPHV